MTSTLTIHTASLPPSRAAFLCEELDIVADRCQLRGMVADRPVVLEAIEMIRRQHELLLDIAAYLDGSHDPEAGRLRGLAREVCR